jgi:hypothetical protein
MARLYAKCSVPANHVKGKLGWTITYQDTQQQEYSINSTIYHNNDSSASLTVYSTTEDISGYTLHNNIASAAGYIQVPSSKGYTQSTQSSLSFISNKGIPVESRIDNFYNGSTNVSSSTANVSLSPVYINGEATNINTNHSRCFNRRLYVSANNSIRFAVGNDSEISGVCFFERDGLFPIGIYKLDVQRFTLVGNTPLKTNRIIWKIDTPQEELTCGTYRDTYSAINLV